MNWLATQISQNIIRLRFPLLLLLLFLFSNCAKQGFPPGGPVDKEPPEVLASFPANGKVNTDPDTQIEIIFNEAINPKTVVSALYFSPRFEVEPKIKIKSDRVIIIPKEPLALNKTYLFTLGTDLKDAHNVNLDQAFNLAFSTGNSIDSGSISGIVYKDGRVTSGIKLALFDNGYDSLATPDSLIPDYLTQTGKDGSYAFAYIAPGQYKLIAFEDKNKNRRINVEREAIGIPFAPLNLKSKSSTLDNINIQLHQAGTIDLYIKSSSVNLDRMGRLKLNRPLTDADAKLLFASAVLTDDSDVSNYKIDNFFPISAYPAPEYLFAIDPLVSDLEYHISFDQSLISPRIDDSLKIISSFFTYNGAQDIKPPHILYQVPATTEQAVFQPGDQWQFYFSEPLNTDLLRDGIHVINASGDSLPVEFSVTNRMTVNLKPTQLQFGSKYELILTPNNIADLSGNYNVDSAIVYRFATIGADTLGSISGVVIMTDSTFAHPTVIEFKPVKQGTGRAESIRLPQGQVQFSISLFPGYYTITAWVDKNENEQYDFGTIIPYHHAEPFTIHLDTFRVRTRFESAGVEVRF